MAALVAVLFTAPASAAAEPADPQIGLTETFDAYNWGSRADIQVQGVVRAVGEHCVLYVERGRSLPDMLLQQLVTEFDTIVYPRVTAALGSEPNPGIDGDPRVVIFIYGFNDAAIMGSFDLYDLIRDSAIDPQDSATSNHREMFYLNLDAVLVRPARAAATAAHELAHLILYYRDFLLDSSPQRTYEGYVATWVEEGLTMYAEVAAGYGERARTQLISFQMSPNKNLTDWQGAYLSDYGASYAFITYLVEHEGFDLAAQLAGEPLDGIAGIDAVLRARGSSNTFATLFDDWVPANFLGSRPPALPPYAYAEIHVLAEPLLLEGPLPLVGAGRVDNYGAVYLDLPSLEVGSTVSVRAVVDGVDGAPLRAALISWDSRGMMQPTVSLVSLASTTTGGAAVGPPGYDRHTLAIWSQGVEGAKVSFGFLYSVAFDPPGGVQFLDVGSDHQFFTYIQDLLERGIVNGKEIPVGSGLWYFRSDAMVLRAQFAKMIVEATSLHTPEVENLTTPTFSDAPPTFDGQNVPLSYPFDYVEEAAGAGIVGGYGDGGFHPWEPIKRIQLVRMILRGAAAAGHPLPAYTGSEAVFADVSPGNPLYQDTMTAYQSGIMTGHTASDGRLYFNPWSSATRGQVAKMTSNLLQLLGF